MRLLRPCFLIVRLLCAAALLAAQAPALTVAPAGTGPSGPGQASLAIVEGRPAIAWADTGNGTVHFARALDASGTAWGPGSTVGPSLLNLKPATCLRVVNGRPAVCSFDGTLRFNRAGDATGTTWPTFVGFPFTVREFTMEIIGGIPALLIWDGIFLSYRRALDADGTAWSGAVPAAPLPTVSVGALTEVQGRPAVAYSLATQTGGLWFVAAQDANGSTWGTPQLAVNTPSAASISMQVAGGTPVISYVSREVSGKPSLRYVRATMADGSAWGEPVTPLTPLADAAVPFAQAPGASLAVIKGKPAVGFFPGFFSQELTYQEAKDSFGATIEAWNPAIVLDRVAPVNSTVPPALLEVNGNPAVAYIDVENSSLNYLRATDASGGTLWPPDIRIHSAGGLLPDGGSAPFGVVPVGTESTLRFTVINPESSADTLHITGLTIDGPDPAEFSILTPPDTSLPGGGASDMVLRYAPLTPGLKTAFFHLTSDTGSPASRYDIILTGNSQADMVVHPAGAPALPDGGTSRFSLTAPGAQSTLVFHITNPGGAPLGGLAVTIDGANSSEYALTAAPASVLAPGEATAFTVRHAPLTAGIKTATLHIANHLADSRNPFDILVRMQPGAVDESFAPSAGGSPFLSMAVEPGGRILAGGNSLIAAFRPDGTPDTSFFSPAINPGGRVTSIAVLRDGRILVGGSFATVGSLPRASLARLFPDGTVDPSFDAHITPFTDGVICMAIQPDGKILAGGYFLQVAGVARAFLVRLAADGSMDPALQYPEPNSVVSALSLLPDGRALAGGQFSSFPSGNPFLTRLNPDGSADPFAYQVAAPVTAIAWRPDGVTLAALFGGGLRRMEPDGTGSVLMVAENQFFALAMQVNGECFAAGDFISPLPVVRPLVFRVDGNGTANPFGTEQPFRAVRKLALQADGKVLLAGDFTSVGNTTRPGLARLTNDAALDELTRQGSTALRWMRGGSAPEVSDVSFEMNTPGDSAWTLLGWGARIPGGWELTGLTLPATCQIRALGRAGGSLLQTIVSFSSSALPSWRLQYFNTPDNTGDAANDADPDHDGLTNFTEFAFGLSPVDRTSNTLPEFKHTGTSFTASFTAPEGREDVLYGAEWSAAMLPGTWTAIPDTGADSMHVFRAPAEAGRVFTRFFVRMQ